MKIRLTEQELHQIVKESVETILSEQTQPDNSIRAMVRESIRQYLKEWEQEYNQAQDKYDFEHDNEEYNKLPWLRRMGRKLTGRKPKDPFPDQTKEQLASKYVQKFTVLHTGMTMKPHHRERCSMTGAQVYLTLNAHTVRPQNLVWYCMETPINMMTRVTKQTLV